MALQSILFRGDPKLEACLHHDTSHIKQGASGWHVSKIQVAISILEGTDIDTREWTTRTYGASTAAAVLAFKQKRKIINYSYQTQADNIVGKMTIAALDKELAKAEHGPAVYMIDLCFCAIRAAAGG